MYGFFQKICDSVTYISTYFWRNQYSNKRIRDPVVDLTEDDWDDDDDDDVIITSAKKIKLQIDDFTVGKSTRLTRNSRTQTDDMTRKRLVQTNPWQFELHSNENWEEPIEVIDLCESTPNKFKNLYRPPRHVRSPHRIKRKSLGELQQKKSDLNNMNNTGNNNKHIEKRVSSNNSMSKSLNSSVCSYNNRKPSLSEEEPIKMFLRTGCSPKENPALAHDAYSKLLNSYIHNKDSQLAIASIAAGSASTPICEIDLTNESSSDELHSLSEREKTSETRNNSFRLFQNGNNIIQQTSSQQSSNSASLTTTNRRRVKPKVCRIENTLSRSHPSIYIDDEEGDDDYVEMIRTSPVAKKNSLENKAKEMALLNKKDWLNTQYEQKKSELEEMTRLFKTELKVTSESHRDNYNEFTTKLLARHLEITESLLDERESEQDTVFPELTPEMMDVVNKASRRQPADEKLIHKFSYTVRRADIYSLTGLNWLNDEVINFYMSLLVQRSKDKPSLPKTYSFNTFFYLKLGTAGFQGVRRWTKKVDIFAHDLLIIPVHLKMHWCLAAIDLINKTIDYYDSMGTTNDQCLNRLEEYLVAECKDKKGEVLNTDDWTKNNVKDIPRQMNGSDCGVFSCTFAEFLTRRAKFTFQQNDMPYIRQKMIYEIVTGTLLS